MQCLVFFGKKILTLLGIKLINIIILGFGQVSRPFIKKVLNDKDINISYIFTKNKHNENFLFTQKIDDILNTNADVIIEAITDTELAKKILLESNVKYYITCNKPLIYSMKNDLNINKKIYLTSIVSGKRKENEFDIPLTNNNIINYSDSDLFCFRFGGGEETAQDMYNDLLIIKNNFL